MSRYRLLPEDGQLEEKIIKLPENLLVESNARQPMYECIDMQEKYNYLKLIVKDRRMLKDLLSFFTRKKIGCNEVGDVCHRTCSTNTNFDEAVYYCCAGIYRNSHVEFYKLLNALEYRV